MALCLSSVVSRAPENRMEIVLGTFLVFKLRLVLLVFLSVPFSIILVDHGATLPLPGGVAQISASGSVGGSDRVGVATATNPDG